MLLNNYLFICSFFVFLIVLFKYGNKKQGEFFLVYSVLLFVFNIVSFKDFSSSFANPSIIVIYLLFLMSIGLKNNYFIFNIRKLTNGNFKLFFMTGILSSFLNNITVVSSLVSTLHKNKLKLILLSFASIIGGTLTNIGTSTNILFNQLLMELSNNTYQFFLIDFFKIGFPLLIISAIFIYFVSKINFSSEPIKVEPYHFELKLKDNSNMVGHSIKDNNLRNLEYFYLAEIIRNNKIIIPEPNTIIEQGDIFIMVGDLSKINSLPFLNETTILKEDSNKVLKNMKEILISPYFEFINKSIKEIGFRSLYNLSILAVYKNNERVKGKIGDIVLERGDKIIVSGEGSEHINDQFIFLNEVHRHEILSKKDSFIYLGMFFSAILLGLFQIVPLIKSLPIVLMYFIVKNYISFKEIKSSNIGFLLVIAAGILISKGLVNTGTNILISNFINSLTSIDFVLILILFFITVLLTELFSNTVAASIMVPIAISLNGFDQASLMAVIFAANASFIFPYNYHTNILIFNYGNFKLREFILSGLLMSAIYSSIVLSLIYYYYFL